MVKLQWHLIDHFLIGDFSVNGVPTDYPLRFSDPVTTRRVRHGVAPVRLIC